MRVAIYEQHLKLNESLAKESNLLAKRFSLKSYSRIENIDSLLLKRDISVEKKKNMLLKKLHSSIMAAFSINKNKFRKSAFESLKKKLDNIRRILNKLRSINYYLETAFLEDLRISKIKAVKSPKLRQQENLAPGELQALEYAAYMLIGRAAALDERLLGKYSGREKTVLVKEKAEIRNLGSTLRKETIVLEHLEAKIPTPKAASISLVKEPLFTHWASRVFALLAYLEHLCRIEKSVFGQLKGNRAARAKISKKIISIIKEKSKLLRIMEEKSVSMKKFTLGGKLKKNLHSLNAAFNL